jgi:translation initiation factor 4E
MENSSDTNNHNLKFKDEWNLWYHSKKDNWTLDGYEKLYKINDVESYWKLYNNWDKLGGINNKHFFLMKDNIIPLWEDESNKYGGCWSFKISEYKSQELWNDLSNYLVTDKLISVKDDIVGLSVCLKKSNFSVIKIWNKSSNNNSLNLINKDILSKYGLDIIYIAHMPEYE